MLLLLSSIAQFYFKMTDTILSHLGTTIGEKLMNNENHIIFKRIFLPIKALAKF